MEVDLLNNGAEGLQQIHCIAFLPIDCKEEEAKK